MSGVLDGIRIVDLCRAGPGQWATAQLADYGADIISIQEPGYASRLVEGGVYVASSVRVNHRNKRSILLNLKVPEGKKIFYKLIERTDALMESNRPGVAQRLGTDYETLKKINPRIVYCSLSGYGQYGPYSNWPGHDLSYQGIGGMLTKDTNGKPIMPAYSQADLNASTNGAMALLMGLLYSQRSGKGEYIDLAFSDGAITASPGGVTDENLRGAHPCYNIYETKDGRYFTLSIREPWFWQRLCQLLGRDDWLAHQKPEGAIKDEMFDVFRETFKSKTLAEWLKILKENDIQFGPVNETMDQVVNDPHIQAREMVIEVTNPFSSEKMKQVGFTYKFSNNPATLRFGPNLMGAETLDILSDLGYNQASIDQFKEANIVGLP